VVSPFEEGLQGQSRPTLYPKEVLMEQEKKEEYPSDEQKEEYPSDEYLEYYLEVVRPKRQAELEEY